MSASSFEGLIPVYLNKEYFEDVLRLGLRCSDIKISHFDIEKLKLSGESYCSIIFRAKIDFLYRQNQETKSLIIKVMPSENQIALKNLGIYSKETQFYLDIKPKIETLMWSVEDNEWNLAPKHYFSAERPQQTIIFEDLCAKGMKMQSRQYGLDESHARAVLIKLGQYHAAAMIVADKNPDIVVKRYPFGLLNEESIKGPAFKSLFGAQLLKLVALVKDRPGLSEVAENLVKYHENFTERVLKAVYPLEGLINTLNHGDLWVNNLFFHYNSAAVEKPSAVEFIDFQLCFYGSLGFDINYFFNTSVELNALRNHRHQLIKSYYESLVATLKRLPYKMPIPNFGEILGEIRKTEAYGFFVSFAFFPLMSMASLDSEDMSLERLQDPEFAQKKIDLMFTSNPRTLETLIYSLQRFNELGIID